MTQSRWLSLVETATIIVAGYCLAILRQVIVFGLFGAVFTVILLVRSDLLRRVFNAVIPSPLGTPINR